MPSSISTRTEFLSPSWLDSFKPGSSFLLGSSPFNRLYKGGGKGLDVSNPYAAMTESQGPRSCGKGVGHDWW